MAIDWDESHGQAYEREPSPAVWPSWPTWLALATYPVGGLLYTADLDQLSHTVHLIGLSAALFGSLWRCDTLEDQLAQERQASHAFEQTATALMQRERR